MHHHPSSPSSSPSLSHLNKHHHSEVTPKPKSLPPFPFHPLPSINPSSSFVSSTYKIHPKSKHFSILHYEHCNPSPLISRLDYLNRSLTGLTSTWNLLQIIYYQHTTSFPCLKPSFSIPLCLELSTNRLPRPVSPYWSGQDLPSPPHFVRLLTLIYYFLSHASFSILDRPSLVPTSEPLQCPLL